MITRLQPKRIVIALSVLLFSSAGRLAHGYPHPCIPLNNADLAEINANKNTAPWSTGYSLFSNPGESHTKLTYTMKGPFVEVGRNPDVNLSQWRDDMKAIFGLAMQWKFTGDTNYAEKAKSILLAWANTHTVWSGVEPYLDLGDYVPRFVTGASILRSYPGWTAANTSTVKNYFNNIHWPNTGINGPNRSANQGAAQLEGAMGIAVYLDDTAKFNLVVNKFRTEGCTGLRTTQSNGQVGDSGRDQGHAYGELWHYAWLAEVAWKAGGVDLFSELNNRLRTCGEYWAQFNNGGTVPYIEAGTCYDIYPAIGGTPHNNPPEAQHLLHGAYVLRKGLSMANNDAYISTHADDWATWIFRKSSDSSTAAALSPQTFPTTATVTTLSNVDIGSPSPAGNGTYGSGTWTVTGGGADYYGGTANDQFHFTYKQMDGDGAMVAKVVSIQNTDLNAKAGVMIRETLAANSKMVYMSFKPGAAGMEVSGRGYDAVCHNAQTRADVDATVPYWAKIERIGNRITTFVSINGTDWSPSHTYDFTMASTCYIGLAVSSHANGTPNTSTFSNVSVTSDGLANGIYTLRNRNSGLFLDAKGQQTTNGTPVQQYAANGGANQQWNVTSLGNGEYKIIGVQSGKTLDVKGQSTANGGIIQLYTDLGQANQKWVITPTSGGYYTIQGVQSGKLMEVFSNATTNSAPVDQWTGNGGNNQQWQFIAP